ncbi:sporulation protein YpjB [Paenibacillaceae bacterium WGS1546]|uniref:sporulation protein YpjB n=1 Tax=Cohnella sp. WGS1546 TaxID=3366810 RepID=UPI00372D63D8
MYAYSIAPRRRRRLRMIGACLLIALIWLTVAASVARGSAPEPSTVEAAASREAYQRFLRTAEALYDAANRGDPELARKRSLELEIELRRLPLDGIASADGVHALSQAVTEMKRATAAVRPDERAWKSKAAALRLAADALAHPDKPIWHRYRSVMEEDLHGLEKALPSRSAAAEPAPKAALDALEALKRHYELIRAAALIRTEPWKVERTDAAIRYANRVYRADSPAEQLVQSTIPALREAIGGLFPEDAATEEALVPPLGPVPPSWAWSATIGSFIVTVLTWVGWRRYRNEAFSGVGAGRGRPDEADDAARKLLGGWKRKR